MMNPTILIAILCTCSLLTLGADVNLNDTELPPVFVALRRNFALTLYGQLTLGTPAQKLDLIFDSGSHQFWVVSDGSSNSNCGDHSGHYMDTKSSTAEKDGTSLEVDYEVGPMKGFLSRDNLWLAGLEMANLTFGEALVCPGLKDFPLDGMLGMGFEPMSIRKPETIFRKLVQQRLISEPIFTFWLEGHNFGPNQRGEILLGAINTRHSGSNPISWYSLSSNSSWQLRIDSVRMFDERTNSNLVLCSTDCQALIATGSPYIIGPVRAMRRINAFLGAALSPDGRSQLLTCDLSKYPTLRFTTSKDQFNLTPSRYIMNEDGECFTRFMDHNDPGEKHWVLGEPFLELGATIFDFANERIGLLANGVS